MNRFEERVQKPTPENKLDVLSDGNFEYETTLPEYYPVECMNYGQVIKVKKDGRVVEKKKRTVFGDPEWIETVNVECHNGIIRGRLARLIRKTKCHSKCRFQLENHIFLFQFYWNFVKPLHGKMSPGMEEGLTHKLWTWGNFLHWQLRAIY